MDIKIGKLVSPADAVLMYAGLEPPTQGGGPSWECSRRTPVTERALDGGRSLSKLPRRQTTAPTPAQEFHALRRASARRAATRSATQRDAARRSARQRAAQREAEGRKAWQKAQARQSATSVKVQLPCLQKDLRTGSISRDIVNFPSELCRRRSGLFAEVAHLLVPPEPRHGTSPAHLQLLGPPRAGQPHPQRSRRAPGRKEAPLAAMRQQHPGVLRSLLISKTPGPSLQIDHFGSGAFQEHHATAIKIRAACEHECRSLRTCPASTRS